jgi:hypothetical protein
MALFLDASTRIAGRVIVPIRAGLRRLSCRD